MASFLKHFIFLEWCPVLITYLKASENLIKKNKFLNIFLSNINFQLTLALKTPPYVRLSLISNQ